MTLKLLLGLKVKLAGQFSNVFFSLSLSNDLQTEYKGQ